MTGVGLPHWEGTPSAPLTPPNRSARLGRCLHAEWRFWARGREAVGRPCVTNRHLMSGRERWCGGVDPTVPARHSEHALWVGSSPDPGGGSTDASDAHPFHPEAQTNHQNLRHARKCVFCPPDPKQ